MPNFTLWRRALTSRAPVRRYALVLAAFAMTAGQADGQGNSAQPGVAALERMKRTYEGKWYRTLTFVQRTIVTRAESTPDTATWYESLSGPARLRIDMGSPSAGNGALFTADTTWSVRNGSLARTSPSGNPFLPLIMGVYLQPVSETVRQLGLFGFDVSKATAGTFEGRAVTIVGTDSPSDSTSAQFWIEDERQVVVRVRGRARGTGGADVHVGGYERVGDAWLGTRVSIVGPTVSQIEEYSDWKVGIPLSEDLFDVTKWRSAPHWAPRTP